MSILAWRPFIDPLSLHGYWWAFLVPLAVLISVVYKAVRVYDMRTYWREVTVMSAQVIVGIVLLGLGSFLCLEFLFPVIVPMD